MGLDPPLPVHMRPPEPDPLPPPCGRHEWMAPKARTAVENERSDLSSFVDCLHFFLQTVKSSDLANELRHQWLRVHEILNENMNNTTMQEPFQLLGQPF